MAAGSGWDELDRPEMRALLTRLVAQLDAVIDALDALAQAPHRLSD